MRIFDDGGKDTNLWFELEPGLFWCGNDKSDAEQCREQVVNIGASEKRLRAFFRDRLTEIQEG